MSLYIMHYALTTPRVFAGLPVLVARACYLHVYARAARALCAVCAMLCVCARALCVAGPSRADRFVTALLYLNDVPAAAGGNTVYVQASYSIYLANGPAWHRHRLLLLLLLPAAAATAVGADAVCASAPAVLRFPKLQPEGHPLFVEPRLGGLVRRLHQRPLHTRPLPIVVHPPRPPLAHQQQHQLSKVAAAAVLHLHHPLPSTTLICTEH